MEFFCTPPCPYLIGGKFRVIEFPCFFKQPAIVEGAGNFLSRQWHPGGRHPAYLKFFEVNKIFGTSNQKFYRRCFQ